LNVISRHLECFSGAGHVKPREVCHLQRVLFNDQGLPSQRAFPWRLMLTGWKAHIKQENRRGKGVRERWENQRQILRGTCLGRHHSVLAEDFQILTINGSSPVQGRILPVPLTINGSNPIVVLVKIPLWPIVGKGAGPRQAEKGGWIEAIQPPCV